MSLRRSRIVILFHPVVKYPEKVEHRSDIMAAVRHPSGMGDESHPGGISYATCHEGSRSRGQMRESHVALFSGDPT